MSRAAPLRMDRHAAFYGSVTRGEAGPGSDLDVLIDIDRATVRDLYDYAGVCRFIGALFPLPVDVAERETLKARIRQRAERDAVAAF